MLKSDKHRLYLLLFWMTLHTQHIETMTSISGKREARKNFCYCVTFIEIQKRKLSFSQHSQNLTTDKTTIYFYLERVSSGPENNRMGKVGSVGGWEAAEDFDVFLNSCKRSDSCGKIKHKIFFIKQFQAFLFIFIQESI